MTVNDWRPKINVGFAWCPYSMLVRLLHIYAYIESMTRIQDLQK
jgi:hypothetical protein